MEEPNSLVDFPTVRHEPALLEDREVPHLQTPEHDAEAGVVSGVERAAPARADREYVLTAGLDPAIFALGGRRRVHWATRASRHRSAPSGDRMSGELQPALGQMSSSIA